VTQLFTPFSPLAFVDIETTGGNSERDRVTEVAVVSYADGQVQRWSKLVNPATRIPAFIQSLTGISDDMVWDAPSFGDIAKELLAQLDGKLFVAHNARFDYGFLRAEFKRAGFEYSSRVLCTVKLSRKLFPHQARHNLDSVVAAHGLTVSNRHRAMSDADALLQFWKHLELTQSAESLEKTVKTLTQNHALPSNIDPELLRNMPDLPGVYLFLDDRGQPLYIGKSKAIRTRVLQHFTAALSKPKEMRLTMQVRSIDWIRTEGELGALLLEAKLVKEKLPCLNVRLRRNRDLWAWQLHVNETPDQPWLLDFVHGEDVPWGADAHLYGVFRSRAAAKAGLEALAQEGRLCRGLLGLEALVQGKPCFGFQVHTCAGACVGQQSARAHNLSVMNALAHLKVATWPYAGPVGLREGSDMHVVDHWRYLGTAKDEEGLAQVLGNPWPDFDADLYKLLAAALRRAKTSQIVKLQPLQCLK
jgi:DNA polymerase-3 subunit epsilon